MRTTCPHCQTRFDIPIRAVLDEAARLEKKSQRKGLIPRAEFFRREAEENCRPYPHEPNGDGWKPLKDTNPNFRYESKSDGVGHLYTRCFCKKCGRPADVIVPESHRCPVVAEPNGNVLSPQDLEAKRRRDAAVRKRLG